MDVLMISAKTGEMISHAHFKTCVRHELSLCNLLLESDKISNLTSSVKTGWQRKEESGDLDLAAQFHR